MMTIRPGDLWLAEIPFTQGLASKRRPVLVLWLDGSDVVVAVITSALPRTITDVVLQDWQASGLRVASTVRLSRLDCLERSLLLTKIGKISQQDARTINQVWHQQIKPGF
ncbi:MAG: PemK-like protein [Alkalinema sp. CACIAM 70d]|nr:MAG: PemK-like protein [Alkalinema sp. CACIAM 70d]